MSKKAYPKVKPGTMLQKIGFWATAWWILSCLYFLLLVWAAMDYFLEMATNSPRGFWSGWSTAIGNAFDSSEWLPWLLLTIITGWLVGGFLWMRELNRQKISYKSAFKYVFLTIRK